MAKSLSTEYLSNKYDSVVSTMMKRASLEQQDFAKINLKEYYDICDIETAQRYEVLQMMTKKYIDIHENEYAIIKNLNDRLDITIKKQLS